MRRGWVAIPSVPEPTIRGAKVLVRYTRVGRRVLAAVVLASVSLIPLGLRAAAQETTTSVAVPPELLSGVTVTGATITTPDEAPRALDASQATAFMQSWLAYSVFDNPANERPPEGLPVSTLEVGTTFNGTPLDVTVFFATDGTTSWVGMPPQNLGWAVVESEKWIKAPDNTDEAFRGLATPVTNPPQPSTTTTTSSAGVAAGDQATSDNGSDDGVPVVAIAAGVLLVAAGVTALVLVTRRSRRT